MKYEVRFEAADETRVVEVSAGAFAALHVAGGALNEDEPEIRNEEREDGRWDVLVLTSSESYDDAVAWMESETGERFPMLHRPLGAEPAEIVLPPLEERFPDALESPPDTFDDELFLAHAPPMVKIVRKLDGWMLHDWSTRLWRCMRETHSSVESALAATARELHLSEATTTLPPSVGRLRGLWSLKLSCRYDVKLEPLPPELGLLTQLRSLSLRDTKLTALPDEIGYLERLLKLSVTHDALRRLPNTLHRLRLLRALILRETQLQSLPSSFTRLESLQFLDLYSNRFERVPGLLAELPALEHLSFSYNRGLRAVDEALARAPALRMLRLDGCEALDARHALGVLDGCPRLERLDLSGVWLPDEPLSLPRRLRALKWRTTHANKYVPRPLSPLLLPSKLRELTFDGYLTRIPAEVAALRKLEILDLDHNQIEELPPEIGELTRLRELYLCDSTLTQLPASFSRLSQLRTLSIPSARFARLDALAPLLELPALEAVYLADHPRDMQRELRRLRPNVTWSFSGDGPIGA